MASRDIAGVVPGIAARLGAEQIADAFDPSYHQSQVDEIFERVGLG